MVTQNELLKRIAGMSSTSDSNQVHDLMRTYKEQASDEEYDLIRKALSRRLNELADQFDNEIRAIDAFLYKAN